PATLEPPTEFPEAVYLGVPYRPDCAFLVRQRLMARFEVEDAHAPHAQPHPVAEVETLVIRPAVRQHRTHRSDLAALDGLPAEADDAGDAAHLASLQHRHQAPAQPGGAKAADQDGIGQG